MKRQNLDAGGWFNPEAATRWEETTRWDGNNHVSRATGSQWEHEVLYRTGSGSWVLHRWSQWQGSSSSWILIEPRDAADWLIRCGHDLPDELQPEADAMEV